MRIIFFTLFVVSSALIVCTEAFKNPECGEPHSVVGLCKAYFESWSYNPDANECVKFIYGGCQGNGNRFSSQEMCAEQCL
ncbi:hypothetical protein ACLKA7_003047 [Drosophila subpalustris]